MTPRHQDRKKTPSRDLFMKITLVLKITASKRTLVSMGYYTVKSLRFYLLIQLANTGQKLNFHWLVYQRFLI